jgi:hypothetical protein
MAEIQDRREVADNAAPETTRITLAIEGDLRLEETLDDAGYTVAR